MRCERCHGFGRIAIPKGAIRRTPEGGAAFFKHGGSEPCPDCGGSGVAHCCDGICEQPEKERTERGGG